MKLTKRMILPVEISTYRIKNGNTYKWVAEARVIGELIAETDSLHHCSTEKSCIRDIQDEVRTAYGKDWDNC